MLNCGTCKKMKTIGERKSNLATTSIVQDCLGCCGKDILDNKGGILYEGAVLLVDPKSLEYYSDINKIIEEKKSFEESKHPELDDEPYPFLDVEYRKHTTPKLLLFEKGKEDATDMIDISRWNFDTIIEFFSESFVEEEEGNTM